jgi:type I restriction enzyme S subunit
MIDGLPEGWEEKTAYDVMEICSGGTPRTDNQEYWNGEIPFFTPKDVKDQIYSWITEKNITDIGLRNCNSKLYPKDTIFITARGTVGKICFAQTDMAMNQSCYALISRKPLNQYFLFFALKDSISQFKSRAVGAVFDAIVIDTFKMIPFTMPAKHLIEEFTLQVTPNIRQIDNLIQQNHKLKEARDLLLPRLMNGVIPV